MFQPGLQGLGLSVVSVNTFGDLLEPPGLLEAQFDFDDALSCFAGHKEQVISNLEAKDRAIADDIVSD